MVDVMGLPPVAVVRRRGIFGWMMFDWAAQPFFTVVLTFIFGPYFVSQLSADPNLGQAGWGYAVTAASLINALAVLHS